MPNLEVSLKDLFSLIGEKISKEKLEEYLEYVKGEVDSLEDDVLKIDCKETNRPDLWSTEGIVRELKARIGKEKGIKQYKVESSNVEVFVDKNLENIRPLIVCAIVKNVNVTSELLSQIIQLQEKVGENYGRKRKEVGIGLYDFDVMKPPVYYKGYKDNDIEFVPLDWKVKMRPSEILLQHEKGKAYRHLLEGKEFYPIVIDSAGVVASMPPIINSESTGKVTEKTKNIFIEVTGFNLLTIETALEVMCMALADRGGKIYSCKINFPKGNSYPSTALITPRFLREKISFDKELVFKKTGLLLSDSQIKDLLERARYNVSISGSKIIAEYPSYRTDVMHAVDVVEDLLISYGYNNIEPLKVMLPVVGSEQKIVALVDFVREGCIGLGLQEVQTYNLSSKQVQEKNMLLKDSFVEIANPVSINYEILRKRLTPQLLAFLAKNKSQEFPQNIFEVGTCLSLDDSFENGVKESFNVCVVLSSSSVNFTSIKSCLVSLCKYLGFDVVVKKKSFEFLNENSAELIVNGKPGFIGEVRKEVLDAFGLRKPVALFEFEL